MLDFLKWLVLNQTLRYSYVDTRYISSQHFFWQKTETARRVWLWALLIQTNIFGTIHINLCHRCWSVESKITLLDSEMSLTLIPKRIWRLLKETLMQIWKSPSPHENNMLKISHYNTFYFLRYARVRSLFTNIRKQ